jgi:hypothetical protein
MKSGWWRQLLNGPQSPWKMPVCSRKPAGALPKSTHISEASARIGSALNIENILHVTAEELNVFWADRRS